MARRRARVWFRFPVGGVQWTVRFGSLAADEQGECDYDKAVLTLSYKLSREKVYQVLWHELTHMSAHESSAHELLPIPMGLVEVYEERYNCTVSHKLFEVAVAMGWLKFPPIPAWL